VLIGHALPPSRCPLPLQTLPPGGYEGTGDVDERHRVTLAASGLPYAVLSLKNSPGGPSADISFQSVPLPDGTPYTILNGTTLVAETNTSGLQGVAVLTTTLPSGGLLVIPPAAANATYAFLTVVRTTLETPADGLVAAVQVCSTSASCNKTPCRPVLLMHLTALQTDWATATTLASNGTLHSTHIAEWAATIWPAGFGTDRVCACSCRMRLSF
jgi:hypothetical protein